MDWLPAFVTAHAGDALWTVAAYLTLALLFPRWPPLWLGLAALATSIAVELSQLIDATWLNSIRSTTPGRWLLGSGFLWIDLLRYLVGAVFAMTIDWCLMRRKPAKDVRSDERA